MPAAREEASAYSEFYAAVRSTHLPAPEYLFHKLLKAIQIGQYPKIGPKFFLVSYFGHLLLFDFGTGCNISETQS